jgi:hypothetical protein
MQTFRLKREIREFEDKTSAAETDYDTSPVRASH